MSKSVLLIKLLDLIKSNPSLNASELAEELGKSERTIYRYLQDLSFDLSCPVYFDQGYKLMGRPRLAPINFSEEEALALRLALGAAPLRKTEPLRKHTMSALNKVEAAMTQKSLNQVHAVAKKVALSVPTHDDFSGKESLLPVLESAVVSQTSLKLRYQSFSSGETRQRVFDPYALVFRRHNWYLVGYCHDRKKCIQLKVSRIIQAMNIGQAFTVPNDFSVDGFYEPCWEVITGDPVEVTVRFDARVSQLITENQRHSSQKVTVNDDGTVIFKATVAGYEEIGWWALSFGGSAEVLEPAEFRQWIVDHVIRMSAKYGQ